MTKDVKIPPPLTAQDTATFAYKTIKDRLPVILVKIIDFFHRNRRDLHKIGPFLIENSELIDEIEADAKRVISDLAILRQELETNKAVHNIKKVDLAPEFDYFNDDVGIWNMALEEHRLPDNSLARWFESPWLLVESYMYRKIKEFMLQTKHLKTYDPFFEQKEAACRASVPQMKAISIHLDDVSKLIAASPNRTHPNERSEFNLLIQLSLWANKADLSLSNMSAANVQSEALGDDIRQSVTKLQQNLLCDNMPELWSKYQEIKNLIGSLNRTNFKSGDNPIYLDLVADNSGYEIFVDLCLLHVLSLLLCQGEGGNYVVFRIHVKRMPWFVSDTMRHDIDWLLEFMREPDQDPVLQSLSQQWKTNFESKFWEVHDHRFWTSPYDFAEMKRVSSDLYDELSKSKLIIFKGDLNYRKLTGDLKWHFLTPFRVALRGFCPSTVVALRTAKADVVVGIEDVDIYARINNNELPQDWRISGDYGMIQYVDPL